MQIYAQPSATNRLTCTLVDFSFQSFRIFFLSLSLSTIAFADFLLATVVGRLASWRIKRRGQKRKTFRRLFRCVYKGLYIVFSLSVNSCAGNSYHVICPYIFITHTQIQSFHLPTHRFPFLLFCFFSPLFLSPFVRIGFFDTCCFFCLHHLLVFAFIKSIMCFCFSFSFFAPLTCARITCEPRYRAIYLSIFIDRLIA